MLCILPLKDFFCLKAFFVFILFVYNAFMETDAESLLFIKDKGKLENLNGIVNLQLLNDV